MRLTFGSVKNTLSRNAAGGVCIGDPRLMDRVNEAMQRLLPKADYNWTVSSVRICLLNASSSTISLPSDMETLIGYNLNNFLVGVIHNRTHEVVDNGPGQMTDHISAVQTAQDRGFAPTFYDVCGNQFLKVYADVTEDPSANLLVKGWDQNNNWVRTFVGGQWIDGVNIPINQSIPQTSSIQFSRIDSVTKPITNGFVRVYQVDPTTSVQALITILEHWEITPRYRRYFIPGLAALSQAQSEGVTMHTLMKRSYRPIMNDNDDLLIPNLGALKMAVKALEFEELDSIDLAEKYWMKAEQILNEDLKNYFGKGMKQSLRIQMNGFAPPRAKN